MKCVVCQKSEAMPDGEVCASMECIKKYLVSGRGSISGGPYKEYMRHCAKVLKEQEIAENRNS